MLRERSTVSQASALLDSLHWNYILCEIEVKTWLNRTTPDDKRNRSQPAKSRSGKIRSLTAMVVDVDVLRSRSEVKLAKKNYASAAGIIVLKMQ